MKRIVFYLTGLLLFACSNAPMTSASVDAEEEWYYGNFRAGDNYSFNDAGEMNYEDRDYIQNALIYESGGKRLFQQCSGYPIPTFEFNGNRAEYEDSDIKLIVEKNGDRFYVEMTAPLYYRYRGNDYYKNRNNYLKVYTTKYFLYRY